MIVADHRLISTDRRDKVPRAQKLCPTKFLRLSPYTRARWIALALLIYPTACDSIFRRYRQHHVHMIGHQIALLYPTLFLSGQLPKHIPKVHLNCPYNVFSHTSE